MAMWSVIKAKYNCTYKLAPADQTAAILSQIARMDFNDEVLEIPKSELEALIKERVKALPPPIMDGELLIKIEQLLDRKVMTLDGAISELKDKGYLVFKKEDVSVSKMVMDYIPVQYLPVMIETAGRRLRTIQGNSNLRG